MQLIISVLWITAVCFLEVTRVRNPVLEQCEPFFSGGTKGVGTGTCDAKRVPIYTPVLRSHEQRGEQWGLCVTGLIAMQVSHYNYTYDQISAQAQPQCVLLEGQVHSS